MPVCRPLSKGLYEIRSSLPSNKIARIIFCFHEEKMVLLHGFIKKADKIPQNDLKLALERKSKIGV